jgi:hypothetical protein
MQRNLAAIRILRALLKVPDEYIAITMFYSFTLV